jgi:hypothetical protein
MPSKPNEPPLPWATFLQEVDALLHRNVELHCLGGFAVSVCYGLLRPTGDIDYLAVIPLEEQNRLEKIAGRNSDLARKHRVYFQYVPAPNLPDNHQQRLQEIFPGLCRRIRLLVLDPYDLALSKLERNSPKDREDVEYLAQHVPLDPDVLRRRYQDELRPYLPNEARHDLTLNLWLDSYFKKVP